MKMSKELLSEVLHCDVCKIHIKDNILEYDCDFDDAIMIRNINIYELAHKCKEWANSKGFDVLSSCNSDGKVWVQLHEYDTKLIGSTEYFHSFSEIEAIFKACQWMLDNK